MIDSRDNTFAVSASPYVAPSEEQGFKKLRWLSATNALLIANIVIFGAMLMHFAYITPVDIFTNTRVTSKFPVEELLRWGANDGPATLGGQYWRVVTTEFVHTNITHLAWNLLFLAMLGRLVERLLGRTRTLIIFLLSGAGCSVASLWWHPTMINVGASGANAGLAGTLIALLIFGKVSLPRRERLSILFWAGLLTPFAMLSGLASQEIDSAGHFGGFATGFAIGAILAWPLRANRPTAGSLERTANSTKSRQYFRRSRSLSPGLIHQIERLQPANVGAKRRHQLRGDPVSLAWKENLPVMP